MHSQRVMMGEKGRVDGVAPCTELSLKVRQWCTLLSKNV